MSRVLIVEGTGTSRASVGQLLRRHGHDVSEVSTSGDIEEILQRETFQSVVFEMERADVRHSSRWESLQRIKEDHPSLDVVVVAPDGTVEEAVRAMRLGVRDYLNGHSSGEDILAALASPNPPVSAEYRSAFSAIIGDSLAMRQLLDLVAKVAATDSTVLITGETGTGKELVGRAVHQASRRRDRPFSPVNSAAFPETLLESELFGHRRGAFTGATANKRGLFEAAHRGTVFLDEVGEMPLSMQAKLLRFLQTGEIRPVGGESSRHVDVRLVTATNRDLEQAVTSGIFREDLYYRLAVIPIQVPPLRERPEDIPQLAHHFLGNFSSRMGKPVLGIAPAAAALMEQYAWPGNVRELENTVERGVALCKGSELCVEDLPPRLRDPHPEWVSEDLQSLGNLERAHILRTLDRVGWNRKRAAEILQVSTTTLWRRLKEFGVDGPDHRAVN